jgi:LacI family transcriptional regulator
MRRPTVNDVAAEAGVSGKSVSRVINGSANISPELRRRVEAAVEKLDYVPNTLARNLKIGMGDAVGVVIDAIADPFFAVVTSTVEAAALDAGLTTVVASTGFDPERESRQVQRMAMQQVRALILAPVPRSHEYLRRYATGRPIVMIDRAVEVGGYDTVRVDDRAAARAAVGHLLRAGHRRIAFVGYDPAFATLRDRLAGYHEALAGQTVDVDPDPGLCTPTPETDADAAHLLTALLAVPDPPTAVFAANTRAGGRMAYALHTTGRVELGFVSFGDFPLSRALRPPVTCVDHDPHAIGRAAMACVLDRLGGDAGPPRDVLVEAALVPRGSGEIEAGMRVTT